jgi:predicted unusual protein kinase regulating ubiquinone biosynthesis (AarF/ABC1/UbiB family)
MACIEEDLGGPVENFYEQLDRDPISAASLGQVHKGILKNGQKVAVKVQRPGLREQITLDLYIVRNIASWLNKNIGLIRSDLVALIDELGKRVFEEMDYINEADNAEKFGVLHQHNRSYSGSRHLSRSHQSPCPNDGVDRWRQTHQP